MSDFCIFTGFENIVWTIKLDPSSLAYTDTKHQTGNSYGNAFTALAECSYCVLSEILIDQKTTSTLLGCLHNRANLNGKCPLILTSTQTGILIDSKFLVVFDLLCKDIL